MSYDENRISDLIDGGLQKQKELIVIEGNKLIAEFMGGKRLINKDVPNEFTYWGMDGFEHESGLYLKYHTSWDWLMPVVEKIEIIDGANYNSVINTNSCFFTARNIKGFNEVARGYSNNSKIEAVWKAVVMFIQKTK